VEGGFEAATAEVKDRDSSTMASTNTKFETGDMYACECVCVSH
jgi:hypothetical protein